ncbi:MAG: (2Fe-2S)-binding protein [Candidatus Bathyarchaeia archaeon]
MKSLIKVNINGKDYELLADHNWSLLDLLREKLRLTGTKRGCEEGECGACTVIMDGKAVNSCLVLAVEADGKKILTIEGLASNGELHPIQKAFIEYHAFQCGFCTPGMIMMAKALLDENPEPTEEDIKKAIVGNICRCADYTNIVKAIVAASRYMKAKSN